MVEELRKRGGGDKIVFGGGITPDEDVPALAQPGVARVFTPGASTQEIVDWIPHQRASPGGVMDFTLSDEHRRIQETMRDFGEREVKPHAAAWDREERFPHETVQRLGALGFLGVALPEDVGGGGADTHANLRVVEGIARYGASLGLTVALLSGASPTGYRCTSFLILGVANPLTVTLVGGATAFASLNEQFQGHPPQPVARAALSRVWLIWRTSERR